MTPEARALTEGLQQRHLTTQLQLREATEDATGWEVEGIGVPYGQEVQLFPGLVESFDREAVDLDASEGALLFYGHREPIGRVIESRNADDGWHHRATISDTTQGRDAHTLAADGVLSKFSVGFEPVEHRERVDDDGTVYITHTKVRVREVSLVPMPAYEGAELSAVRHDTRTPHTPQPPTTREDHPTMGDSTATTEAVADLQQRMSELQRRIELGLPERTEREAHPLLAFRSMGEFIKAVATGDERAQAAYTAAMQVRAYDQGGTTADVDIPSNSWVGDLIEVAQAKQPVASSFLHTMDLPGEGMGVDYGILGQDSTQVGQQAAEGDDLPFGKVSVGHDTAGIGTFGGWSQLTRQEIERMPVNMLDLTWRGLTAAYGRRIELLARGVFTAAHTTALGSAANRITLGGSSPVAYTAADALGWLGLVLDAAELFDDRGRDLSGFKVSRDVFMALASVESTDRLLVVSNAPAGSNGGGTLDVSIPEANLYGIRVELVPGWAGANLAAYDRAAIRTQEAPGAPFRLQDGNIINLSQAFSLYGYAASYQQLADGIVAANLTGTAA